MAKFYGGPERTWCRYILSRYSDLASRYSDLLSRYSDLASRDNKSTFRHSKSNYCYNKSTVRHIKLTSRQSLHHPQFINSKFKKTMALISLFAPIHMKSLPKVKLGKVQVGSNIAQNHPSNP